MDVKNVNFNRKNAFDAYLLEYLDFLFNSSELSYSKIIKSKLFNVAVCDEDFKLSFADFLESIK